MNELPRQKLVEIFAKKGRSMIENPRRLEGLLRDYCGAHKREISVLVAAVEEHAVLDLLAASPSVPRKVLLSRLAQRLCDNLGLSMEAARWAIESWALALGLVSDAEVTSDKSTSEAEAIDFQENKTFAPARAVQKAAVASAANQSKPTSVSLIVAIDGSGHFTRIAEALRNAPPNSLITVREGLYNESLELNKSVHIVGEGNPQKIIVSGANSSPLVVRTIDALVRGITLQARAAQTGKAFFAVEIMRGELVLENCDVTSDSLSGIAVHGSEANPLIKNCRIYDCADSGIYIFDQSSARVESCDVYRNRNVNVAVTGGANPTLKDCRIFEGGNGGVVVWGNGTGGLIENCFIYAHRLANVGVRENADPLFRNCEIYDGHDTGIYIHQNGRGTFEDCRISRNAKAGVGISQNAASVLRRSVVRESESSGVVVQNRGRLLVESCDIYGNADAGVAIYTESEVVVRGCRIKQNGTVAVRIKEGNSASVADCDLRGNQIATWETEHGIGIERRNNLED